MLPQERVIDFEKDDELLEFFKICDIMLAFKELHSAWLMNNKDDWYSLELIESINICCKSIDNLASYVSLQHSDIKIQIGVDFNTFKNKQFSTVLRHTPDWKTLKKYLRSEHSLKNQSISSQALFKIILKYMKDFVSKM